MSEPADGDSDAWTQPFDAEVAVLDLRTGAHHRIGRARGGWTQTTAIPHPYLTVRWADGSTSPPLAMWETEGMVTFVDPTTERLTGSVSPGAM